MTVISIIMRCSSIAAVVLLLALVLGLALAGSGSVLAGLFGVLSGMARPTLIHPGATLLRHTIFTPIPTRKTWAKGRAFVGHCEVEFAIVS